jgi:two-component system uhpT operon response regulator UhpA
LRQAAARGKLQGVRAVMTKRKILLVDDHPIVRKGFAMLLAEDSQNHIVAQFGSGEEVLTYAKQQSIDVAVVDINMDDMNGLQLSKKLKTMHPEIKIVILSVNEIEPFISKSFDAGADAFLSKRCAPEELIQAIKSVCEGEQYLSQHVYRQIALDKLNNKDNVLKELTSREFEVFQYLAQGDSMKSLSKKLNISPKTGYVFRGNILRKLELESLAELIQLAHRHQII